MINLILETIFSIIVIVASVIIIILNLNKEEIWSNIYNKIKK